jgi:hypothetical protein
MTEGMRRQSQDGPVGGEDRPGGEDVPPAMGFDGLDGLDGLLLVGGIGGKLAGSAELIGPTTGCCPLSLHILLTTCTACNLRPATTSLAD